jgi:hypothetical protein
LEPLPPGFDVDFLLITIFPFQIDEYAKVGGDAVSVCCVKVDVAAYGTVPEPSALLLLGCGAAGIGVLGLLYTASKGLTAAQ